MARDGYETAVESFGSKVNSSNGKLPDTSQADGLRDIQNNPCVVYRPGRRINEQRAKASADYCYSDDDDYTDTDSIPRGERNGRKESDSRRQKYYKKYEEAHKVLKSVGYESEADPGGCSDNDYVEGGPLLHTNRKTDQRNNTSGLGTGRLKTKSSGNKADTSSKSKARIASHSGGLGPGGQSYCRPRASASRATTSAGGEKRLPGVPRHYGRHERLCGDILVRLPETDSESINNRKNQARKGLESRPKLKPGSIEELPEIPLRRDNLEGKIIRNVGKQKKVSIKSKLNTNLHTVMDGWIISNISTGCHNAQGIEPKVYPVCNKDSDAQTSRHDNNNTSPKRSMHDPVLSQKSTHRPPNGQSFTNEEDDPRNMTDHRIANRYNGGSDSQGRENYKLYRYVQKIGGRDERRVAQDSNHYSSRGEGASAHKFDNFLSVKNFAVYNSEGNLVTCDQMGKGKDREVQEKKKGAVKRLMNLSAAMKMLGRRKRNGN